MSGPGKVAVGEALGLIAMLIWLSVAAGLATTIALALPLPLSGLSAATVLSHAARWLVGLSVFISTVFATVVVASLPVRLFVRPGIHPLDGRVFLWFGFYHGLFAVADWLFLRVIRGTHLMKGFYQLLGARVGPRTIVNTNQISDCHLVVIGADCIIGADAVLNPHSGEAGRLHVAPIRIGNGVTVGQYAVILSGVVIEDGVTIGAHSVVPKGSILRKGRAYGGVPVRQLDLDRSGGGPQDS